MSVRLPIGELTESSGYVRISTPSDGAYRAAQDALRDRLAQLQRVPCPVMELVASEVFVGNDTKPFSAALSTFRSAPRVHLPELVGLARYIALVGRIADHVGVPLLFSPATVRYMPQRPTDGGWNIVMVPTTGVTVADWARSDPAAWAWTSGREMLGQAGSHAYTVAAALASGLVDLFPQAPSSMQFKRALRGWVGQPARIRSAIHAALPQSFTDEAAALSALVIAMLEPAPPNDWEEQLAAIGEKLLPYRVAVRWEYEGTLDVARGILERMAATHPREHVPWDVLSRLRVANQDYSGAVQVAIDAIETGDGVRDLAAEVRRLAHSRPPAEARPLIERAIEAVDRLGARLGDAGRLHFAHIEARYLDRGSDAQRRLATACKEPWDNVLRGVILARVHASRSEHAHVGRICKEAKASVRAMPAGGRELGTYVCAYLDYLDGVAHYGATTQYNDPGYLADAFSRIVASLDATAQVCDASDPLIEACVHWLHWIGDLANQMKIDGAKAIRTGIDAYLSSTGLLRRISEQQRRERPPLVWYDAGRLLALSGAP